MQKLPEKLQTKTLTPFSVRAISVSNSKESGGSGPQDPHRISATAVWPVGVTLAQGVCANCTGGQFTTPMGGR